MGRDGVLCSGREAELARAAKLLELAGSGAGGVILIRGVPGVGKTVLLRQLTELAARRGFTIMEFGGIDVPTGQPPSITLSAERPSSSVTIDVLDVGQLRSHIEAQTVHGPVLLVGDDAHRVRQGGIRAFVPLLERLSGQPVVWAIACQATTPMAELARRIAGTRIRACLLDLGPLAEDAVAELVERLAGGKPGQELMKLVDRAGGDPALVTDLISGLVAERALEAVDGIARLRFAGLPRQVMRTAQRRLDELSDRCRQLVTVAAALGRTVSFDDISEILDESPGNLLVELEEAIRAGVLASRAERITFANELLWRAVGETVPTTVANALRQRVVAPAAPASPEPPTEPVLNDIEREIVAQVSRGLTNGQIARRLMRSEHTVNYHLQKMYRRLNVHSRAELVGLLQRDAI